jgi:peptide/nickel transport system permease protein
MVRFLIMRLLALVLILFVLATIVFFIRTVIPTNPARTLAGPGATPQLVALERQRLGLNKPLMTQYIDYLEDAVQGNLGMSIRTRDSVASDLGRAIPASIELLLAAFVVVVVLGLALGLLGAASVRGATALRLLMVGGASVPSFLLGLLALVFLYSKLHLFPDGGRLSPNIAPPSGPTGLYVIDGLLSLRFDVVVNALWHLALPALVLGIGPALVLGRILQSSLRTVMTQDYIRTARAKALIERRVLLKHALRNALNAPLSLTGLEVGAMLAGIAVVEDIFSWPGIGQYTVQAITFSDFPAIAGVTLVIGVVYVVVNAMVDIAQVIADPRLRARSTI